MPPLGSHFAAWQMVQGYNLRWIADFRDPLAHEWKHSFLNPVQKRLYRHLERAIAKKADAIVVNTDAALTEWTEKYPSLAGKIHLTWNGFDPDDRIQPLPIPNRNYAQLSHVGELYLGRDATPILRSIARLIERGRLSSQKLRVNLIGSADLQCLPDTEFIRSAEEQGWLKILNEQIPLQEARQVAQTSDGLLLLQPHSNVQVPGKLFEYLQIGRPILAFVQRNSPAERILERSGVLYTCVYTDMRPEDADRAVAEFFELQSSPLSASAWFQEHFNAKYQTQALDGIISSLHPPAHPERRKGLSSPHVSVQTAVSVAPTVPRGSS
jgi:hypothetical protein